MTSFAHRSFSAGEVTPSLHARVDTAKYQTGLHTLRNMTVRREGGIISRAGSVFVGPCKDAGVTSYNTVLVPFVYDEGTGYILEFGNLFMRVIRDGSHVIDSTSTKNVTAITSTGTAQFTAASHGLLTGDPVRFAGATKHTGAEQLGSDHYSVYKIDDDTFTVLFQVDDHEVQASELTAYVGSGITVSKLYSLSTPFTSSMLPDVRYSQSGNQIVFAHPSVKPRTLKRNASDDSWTIASGAYTPLAMGPTSATPSDAVTPRTGSVTTGPTYNSYKVTTIAKDTGEESLPWRVTSGTVYSASGFQRRQADDDSIINTADGAYASASSPVQYVTSTVVLDYAIKLKITVLASPAPVGGGAEIRITGTDDDGNTISDPVYTISGQAPEIFITSYSYKTITSFEVSGGSDFTFNLGIVMESRDCEADLTWTAPTVDRDGNTHPAIAGYNIYADKRGTGSYGWIGFTESLKFHDTGIQPDLSRNPPTATDPFDASDKYPSCVAHYQQRLVFAGSNNNPERIWASKINRYGNYDVDYPITDDDAIIFDLAGGRSRKIQHILPLERLVLLTTLGEVVCGGDSAGVLTPGSVNLRQASFNGASRVPPLTIGGDALYVQSRGSAIRSLSYELQSDGYRGTDLSVFSSHLFEGKSVVSWCHQQTPDSIVWAALDDGSLVSLTFMPEQQVYGWSRHDTDGDVKALCSIPGATRDEVYMVVVRDVAGTEKKFVERLSDRFEQDREDLVLVDSALTYDGRNTTSTELILSGGSAWDETDTSLVVYATAATAFAAQDVGKVIVMRSGDDSVRLEVLSYVSSASVSVQALGSVPASLRTTATADWGLAVDSLLGLRHLGTAMVSVCGDSNVLASPNNDEYPAIAVADGAISLPEHAEVVHVGLPITCDVETLDVDTLNGETIIDKRSHITSVTLQVRKTAGFFVGSSEPDGAGLEGLQQPKMRDLEGYDDAIDLHTGKVSVQIRPEWKSNGRVFVRHADPTPLEILSIVPSGGFDLRRGAV